MAAWGTTSQTNFDKLNKVQNKATRIITCAMKSMPITSLDNITGLEPIPKVLCPPPWKINKSLKIITEIKNIGPKCTQLQNERKEIATQYIQTNFPEETWIRVYTDGSLQ